MSDLPDCCLKVYQYDSRTPGLFKEEFRGDGIVALNSKTYFCWQNNGPHNFLDDMIYNLAEKY